MQWIKDKTGRFINRPHFKPDEIDLSCEQIIQDFLLERYKKIAFPISTDDLTVLIESRTEDFDRYADLSEEGEDVEGMTEFERGKKPCVKISNHLDASNMENRFRTTLAHELFHVIFHDSLFQIDIKPRSLFDEPAVEQAEKYSQKCKRDNIIGASSYDWMEWQAGYGCGAFLMPINSLKQVVFEFREKHNDSFGSISIDSLQGQGLIQKVSVAFRTSKDASRVRLLQKGFIQENNQVKAKGLF